MSFMDYWDKVFCINLDRRTDRWEESERLLKLYGITAERFSGHDNVMVNGRRSGNAGCTASHRGILELIAHNKWDKVLVLEDDFCFVHVPDVFHRWWDSMIQEVPNDWDFLYLGGHYADAPKRRISPHVIQFNRMLTTSSYGIRWQKAKEMAPYIYGDEPIDSLFSGFTEKSKAYIFQPRFMVQKPSFSDIQECEVNHTFCMLDRSHEQMV